MKVGGSGGHLAETLRANLESWSHGPEHRELQGRSGQLKYRTDLDLGLGCTLAGSVTLGRSYLSSQVSSFSSVKCSENVP